VRCTHYKQVGRFALILLLAAGAAVAGAQVRATSTSLRLSSEASKVTATVHVAGSSTPTGVVTLIATDRAISHDLGSVALDATGNGTLTFDANAATGQIAAQYRGDTINGNSTSEQVKVQPQTPVSNPDYTFALSVSSLPPVKAGSYGTTVASVTPTGGFTQNVSFFCTGLPDNSQCVFTPPSVQTSNLTTVNPTVTSTLQILTTSPSGNLSQGGAQSQIVTQSTPLFLAVSLALGLLLVSRGKRLQKLRVSAMLLMGGFLLLGLSGCSARYSYLNHPPSPANTGTPVGTYNITVTASSDNGITTLNHTVPVVLTVD
jgi:hypothetical protein